MPQLPGYGFSEPYASDPENNLVLGRISNLNGGSIGYVWSEGEGYTLIGDLPGGNARSGLTAIKSDGSYGIGFSSFAFNSFGAPINRAVSWTPDGGLQPLQLPPGDDELAGSLAYQMLPDGRIFGRSESGIWLYSEIGGFEILDGAQHMTRSSADGSFFSGTSLATGNHPAYWTRESGLQHLPLLGDHFFGNVLGMSADGSVIVGTSQGVECVWIDQGEAIEFIDYAESFGIDMTGWSILNMGQVSADGRTIVGTARHASWEIGRVEGFVLTIPAPASAGVLGAVLVAFRRRR